MSIEKVPMTYEGIVDGALYAVDAGITFDEYCELISKMVISGQSKDFIKGMFIAGGIHLFFQGLQEGVRYMISQEAARYYLNQPNTYSVVELREKFEGKLRIEGGKPHILFPDETTLSIQKIVRAKFAPEEISDVSNHYHTGSD